MIQWPTVDELRDGTISAMDMVADRNRLSLIHNRDWTTEMFVEIKNRLARPGLEFQALRQTDSARSNGFLDKEFIYDFTANVYDDEDPYFLIQTAVAGESEWNIGETEEWWDFHKLLQSDAIFCFMIFAQYPEKMLESFGTLTRAIAKKQSARREHGLSTSAYLLSCRWNYPIEYEFKHMFIASDSKIFDHQKSAGWVERSEPQQGIQPGRHGEPREESRLISVSSVSL